MAVLALNFTTAEPRAAVARDPALDFTKGTLVLFMVLYHWLNYFVGIQGEYYNYLRFLTPSFIFITGFMISRVHFQKYETQDLRLSGRLVVRGLKLLAVFVSLNVLIDLALSGSLPGSSLAARFLSVFTTGDVTVVNITAGGYQKSAAFTILVPIAYLLIVSAGLTLLRRRVKYAFHYACGLLILGILVLSSRGMHSFNLELLMVGVLGVVFGYARREQIAALASHPYVLCGLYCVYLVAVTMWDVTLPVQTIGVLLTTALIYIAGKSREEPGLIRGHAILLGKYSLFGYISQIAILQVLRRTSWFSRHGVIVLLLSLLLGFVLTVIVVEVMDWARMKSRMVNGMYQFVFA